MISEFQFLHFLHKLDKLQTYHHPFEQNSPESKHEDSEDEKNDPSTQDEHSVGSESEGQGFVCATEVLAGLQKLNVKVYLVSENLGTLATKGRLEKLFDVAVVGFYHTHHAGKEFPKILRDQHSVAYIELPKNFVGIKAEVKESCYKRQADIVREGGLKMLKSPYSHHYLFGFAEHEYVPAEETKAEAKKDTVTPEEKKKAEEKKDAEPSSEKATEETEAKSETEAN